VDSIHVISVLFASVIQIGDSNSINGLTRALAVQRQREIFYGKEGDFSLFKIFSYQFPPSPIYEPLTVHRTSTNPVIKVGSIDVTAFSSTSFLHIGSTEKVEMESRILHIRQIETINESKDTTSEVE
jgi:spore germination protein PE